MPPKHQHRAGFVRAVTCLIFLVAAISLSAATKVTILTPHNEAIRIEFGRAFAAWHLAQFGETAVVEWRNVGGTTDALRFVQSEFSSKPGGIGIDIFFGGGPEPYLLLADKKFADRWDVPPEILDGIPQTASGVEVYDRDHLWYGAALSSFGILQNLRVQQLTHLPFARRWEDLTRPELCGWVGAGDPRNSGTMNTMFETFLQFYGWEKGWLKLAMLGGNVRKFDRESTTTAKDVTLGETAYAMAIDFYGFTQVAAAGRTNLTFALPEDFTAINADGIALLHGAPNRETAGRFINFTLSEPGQKLWFLPKGHPDGPKQYSIERMIVRPDLYRRFKGVSNIEFSPFELQDAFNYDSKLARTRREVVAALIGALLVDTHPELQKAWRAIIDRHLTPVDLAELGQMPVTEAEVLALAKDAWKDPALRNQKKIAWQSWAQQKYRKLASDRRAPSGLTTSNDANKRRRRASRTLRMQFSILRQRRNRSHQHPQQVRLFHQ
ncbi:MAG: ABC transporter substrate-binding protein [Opitutaceae bacterium]|nr:ABC transporter substrate-binding protein [Verrucomicrobiales bacterium]